MSELDYARECGTEPEPAEDERLKRLLAEVRQDIAETSPNSSPMGVFRQHCEDLLQVVDGLLPVQPAPIDFSCRICGVQCVIAPDPPARAVCPEHCEDHDYEYDRSRAGRFCIHCDEQRPEDWDDD